MGDWPLPNPRRRVRVKTGAAGILGVKGGRPWHVEIDGREAQIVEHRHGQPIRAPSLHRFEDRSALLFHEVIHWLGHEHGAIHPDVTHLYETCCFGGSDYIRDEALNRAHQQTACAILREDDIAYLGRIAVAERHDARPVVLVASPYQGLYGVVQSGAGATIEPAWLQCFRSTEHGDRLEDVAAARWQYTDEAGEEQEKTIAAIVGHRRIEILEVKQDTGRVEHLLGIDLEWAPYRVALDPLAQELLVAALNAGLASEKGFGGKSYSRSRAERSERRGRDAGAREDRRGMRPR